MKKDKLKRLPMLDETILVDSKDWLKYIRSEVQHLRQAYTKTVKKGNKLSTACLDLTPAMEKRRTMAVMSSLENLDASRKKYAMDWIALNVFSENYAPILSTGHLLTAASMWILDRLTELNIDFDAVYPLLPTDETEIEDFYIFDVWDCQYDEDLIASVEYVLHNRNQDIAPLESSGGDGFRVITSDLAANGRDRADVPSRKNFEGLLELLPEWMKKQAVKHFEECYQVWMDRFFAGIAYLQIELHDKRSKVNSIRREINEQMEQFEKKTAQVKKERKFADAKPRKQQVNPLLNKPVQPVLPTITQNSPLTAVSSLSAMINGNAGIVDKDRQEIDAIIERLEILGEQQGKAIEEFDNALDNLANFIYTVKHNGYLTTEAVNSLFPPELHSEIMKPLPMTDPYELCFALIYLVEIGSDIPWLYGSCIGMMTEVADHLPWGIADYEEDEDPYWDELPALAKTAPKFPDWYKREYAWQDDSVYDARNLAQMLYETTGCVMPRDLSRYDAELKKLGKYGIKQNKAIAMLYCMIALSNARRRSRANNLMPDCMDFILNPESEPVEEDKQIPEDWQAQRTALEKQVQQLKSDLYRAEKTAADAKKKLEQQKANAEAEHRELADLREVIFNQDELNNANTIDETVNDDCYPYTVQNSTVVFGGHETWVKALKPLLKGDIKFIAKEMKIDVSLVRYADVIWIQTNAIPHRSYYSIVNTARKYGKPIRYFTNASAVKAAEQIVENDKMR